MEAKGAVQHEAVDRVFVFKPMYQEDEVATTATHDLLARVFNSSVSGLVAHLLKHEKISAEELRQLRQLIEDRADVVIGNGVEEIRTVHRERIERTLLVHRRRQEVGDTPALGRPGADDIMVHRHHLAVGIEAGLDFLVGQWSREIHRHVVFARVDHLDRLADRFGGLHCRHRHVAV